MEPDDFSTTNSTPSSNPNQTEPSVVNTSADNSGMIAIAVIIIIAIVAMYFFYRPHSLPVGSQVKSMPAVPNHVPIEKNKP